MRSFLARIPVDEARWVVPALGLPYLLRPGAGRMNAAPERLVAPILARQWDGRSVLRYNGADYASLRDGRRILRVDALPAEWYRTVDDHVAAQRVLPLLRALFADVDSVAAAAAASRRPLASLALRSGDVLLVSNKAGPHCRSTFDGPRYVQRLYSDYSADKLWDAGLNVRSGEQRQAHLAACCARDLDAAQMPHLERHLGVPIATAAAADADVPTTNTNEADAERVAALGAALAALEAAIDDVAHLLMEEEGHGSPAVVVVPNVTASACGDIDAQHPQPLDLLEPLRCLHAQLGALRRAGCTAWRDLPAAALALLRAACDALTPLAFRLRDDNLHEELLRVRAAVAAPCAINAIGAAVKAAAEALGCVSADVTDDSSW